MSRIIGVNLNKIIDFFKKFLKVNVVYQLLFYRNINVTNVNSNKRVLLSYINQPFNSKKFHYHQNRVQARVIADVFSELGYSVDVYNYRYKLKIDYKKYDVVFGFGLPLEKSFFCEATLKRIYYATGAHTNQRNIAEVLRVRDLYHKRGVYVKPKRLKEYPDLLSSILSDVIVCVGNQWTIDTYKKYYLGTVYRVPIGVNVDYSGLKIDRNILTAKNNFLWIGGSGSLLKGLDLCLDYFSKRQGIVLHICGRIDKEIQDLYSEELSLLNIKYYGFMDVRSEDFINLLNICAFILFPSASEGGGGSVLTGMAGGLIPIVTDEASVDLGDYGIRIESNTIEGIGEAINKSLEMSASDIYERSHSARDYVKSIHNFANYECNLRNALHDTLIGDL